MAVPDECPGMPLSFLLLRNLLLRSHLPLTRSLSEL